MDDKDWFFFFQMLHDVEGQIDPKKEKQVMIEKAINLRLMCDFVVSCSYGDIVLIISMLHDYVKMLDARRGDDIQYQVYYRKKFLDMANRLAEQINYDYEAAVEKCRKKREKEEAAGDVGEEAMALMVKRGLRAEKKKAEEGAGQNNGEGDKSKLNQGAALPGK